MSDECCYVALKVQTGSEKLRNGTDKLDVQIETNTPGCLGFLQKRPWILPLFTSLWLFFSIFITVGLYHTYAAWMRISIVLYIIGLALGHISENNFPYISHTAIDDPERAVFGQLVNIGAVLLGCNDIVRYLYIKHMLYLSTASRAWHKCNMVSCICGILSAFGLSMVGNFQTELHKPPHYVGAGLSFVCGTVYCWIQAVMSRKIKKRRGGSKAVYISQFIISFAMTSLLLLFAISKLSYKLLETSNDRKIVSPHLMGVYLTSTVSEWLLALSVSCFLLTYIPHFRKIKLKAPRIQNRFSVSPVTSIFHSRDTP